MTNIVKLSRRSGFTLVELLTVIAIIGILAGILIPVVGGAKRAALRAQARSQFVGWATALEQYKKEYGYYPPVGSLNTGGELDLSTAADTANFIRALSGREPNGDSLSDRTMNKKAILFYSFGQAEQIDVTGNVDDDGLYDPFGNNKIKIVVDHDGNGVIESDNYPGSEDLKSRVAIWTVVNDGEDFEEIQSWN